jgi:DNA helicase HerA-like ATPase
VTLQTIAEQFSARRRAGVPGRREGRSFRHRHGRQPRSRTPQAGGARQEIGITDYAYADNPAVFWDLYGEQGHPIRTTISEMGPLLLARLMGLNETQEGVLNIAFRYADEERAAAARPRRPAGGADAYCAENADELSARMAMSPRPASARSSASC